MKKYRAKPQPVAVQVLGMLYIVDVRLVQKADGEKIKHRILLVGCEQDDIDRKIRWLFDAAKYKEIAITGIEKVREKVHFLSTTISQERPAPAAVIDRDGHSQPIPSAQLQTEQYDPNLYAVGLSAAFLAKDEAHAIRKAGRALINTATEGKSHTGGDLPEGATLTVEQIPKSSGYALPRDVSEEANKAHFVRG